MELVIQSLIGQLEQIQDGKPWIGTNYSLRMKAISDNDFFRRPNSDIHSVAEIIAHLTVWRKETRLKIESGEGSITDQDPSNWPNIEILEEKGRISIMQEYNESLEKIIEQLKNKDDSFLDQQYYDTDFKAHYPYSFVLNGMLHHDLYHLGQLGYIVKLLSLSRSSS